LVSGGPKIKKPRECGAFKGVGAYFFFFVAFFFFAGAFFVAIINSPPILNSLYDYRPPL
jgi:hypothetical protein